MVGLSSRSVLADPPAGCGSGHAFIKYYPDPGGPDDWDGTGFYWSDSDHKYEDFYGVPMLFPVEVVPYYTGTYRCMVEWELDFVDLTSGDVIDSWFQWDYDASSTTPFNDTAYLTDSNLAPYFDGNIPEGEWGGSGPDENGYEIGYYGYATLTSGDDTTY